MHIYIGNVNISSLMDDLRYGFESLGHTIFTMSQSKAGIQSATDLDIDVALQKKIALFCKRFPNASAQAKEKYAEDTLQALQHHAISQAIKADICIFIWNSFSENFADLPLLRQENVKTAVLFAGSEARVLPLENHFRQKVGMPPASMTAHPMEKTLYHIRSAELHADLLLGISMAALRPSYSPITTIQRCDNIPFHIPDREEPTIIHAPSNRSTKNTATWLQIFAQLHAEGHRFKIRLIENVEHSKFLGLLQDVDIVCDGLSHGGKLAREGMAAGCAVLSGFGLDTAAYHTFFQSDDDFLRKLRGIVPGSAEDSLLLEENKKKTWYYHPEINPCIAVTPETAKDKLRELLTNTEMRRERAIRGRKVLEEYCQPTMVAADILHCLADPHAFSSQAKLSRHSSLLYSEYVPTSQKEAELLNNSTNIVKQCAWYKDLRAPCVRDGLVF